MREVQNLIQHLGRKPGIKRVRVTVAVFRDTFAVGFLREHGTNWSELARLLGLKPSGLAARYKAMAIA